MSFQFSMNWNLDLNGRCVFGIQQIGSPENQFPAPLASRTLPFTHHPSPGPRSEAKALLMKFRVFLVLPGTAPERTRLFLFTRRQAVDSEQSRRSGHAAALKPQAAGGRSASLRPVTATAAGSHQDGGSWSGPVCFPCLLWSWGSGAGWPGQAGASGTLT